MLVPAPPPSLALRAERPHTAGTCSLHLPTDTPGPARAHAQVLLVPPDTKLSATKKLWAEQVGHGALSQKEVRDEYGYVIGSSDWRRPVTDFSNRCNLNLDFTHPQVIGKV